MAVLIACDMAGAGGVLAAVTAALVLITGEVRRRWEANAIKTRKRAGRRAGER